MDMTCTTVVFFIIAVAEAAVMLPLLTFLVKGWHSKRRDIVDGLNEDACQAYFAMFRRNVNLPDKGHACDDFFKLYDRWYGRKQFIPAAILLFLASIFLVSGVVLTVLSDNVNYINNPFFALPTAAIAAITGAYMWVVNDQIARARRLDMTPTDVQWAALRLIISVPMGYAFASLLQPALAPFVTFALGAFPISALIAILQKKTNKALDLGSTEPENFDGVIKLIGANLAVAERLASEDIYTVTQMAYCDPVHITMRSNLSFNVVTDMMGQALVWIYLLDRTRDIAPLGMRGAVEIKHFMLEYDYEGQDAEQLKLRDDAKAALPYIAEALKQKKETVVVTFRQIADDPFTEFLYTIWT